MTAYRIRFSEPWELASIVATVVIEVGGFDPVLDELLIGKVTDSSFDDAMIGRRAEIRPRMPSDRRPLSQSPIVNLAVEDAIGWKGIGFGKISRRHGSTG